MLKLITILFAALVIAALSSCRSAGAVRTSAGIEAARKAVQRDAGAEFRRNLETDQVQFYSYGSLMYGDHFPGLTADEMSLWIERRGVRFSRQFQDDPQPFFVNAGFTTGDYWQVVNEFLSDYNHMVLAYLKAQHNHLVEATPAECPATARSAGSGAPHH